MTGETQPRVSPLARALLVAIRDLSEDHWAAGWYSGIEFHLWGAVELRRRGEESFYGDEAAEMLEALATAAGGWWRWPEEAHEEQFVGFVDWLPEFRPWFTPERQTWLEKEAHGRIVTERLNTLTERLAGSGRAEET